MGRAPCCDKANVKKGPWSPEEDATLKSYIHQNGTGGNWIALPQKIGLKRCGKSCRLRWLNYLRPNIKHGGFSEEEDNIICSLYISIGSRWSIIAAQLPGRTDNDVKNYWNTRLKKKLLGKQRRENQERNCSRGKRNLTVSDSNILITQNQLAVTAYEPQMLLPPIPYSNEEPRFNNHSSIRKLLIKLGGKFSNQIDGDQIIMKPYHEDPMNKEISNLDIHQQMLYTQSIHDLVCPNNYPLHLPNEPHFMNGVDRTSSTLTQGQNGNLESVVYENPQKLLGLEFSLYGDIINNTSTSNFGESIDWGQMNSLVFPSSTSDNSIIQGQLLQGVEEFAIDHKISSYIS